MSSVSFESGRSAAKVHHSLRRSLKAMEAARQCAVLWFAEVMRRRLYEELGYSSINQYASKGLGFSRTRTGDFIRLAQRLDKLPAVREAMASGDLGYTKAREIVGVATPETQDAWLEAARKPRRELVDEITRVKRAAAVDPGQAELLPGSPTVVDPKELPVRFQVDLSPEQEARRAALVERLHKLGATTNDKAELMLEALSALVEAREKTPRGALGGRPGVQIHVHEKEGRLTVRTRVGERELDRADAERMKCDAIVCTKGGRNKATIPPRIRREVLARDGHRCRAPGCSRTHFLEVHHVVPRSSGGTNHPGNLVVLCSGCHRLWHTKGLKGDPVLNPEP